MVVQGSFDDVLRVFCVCVLRVFQWSFEGVSRECRGCSEGVSRMFQGWSKGVLRVFQWCLKVVSWEC